MFSGLLGGVAEEVPPAPEKFAEASLRNQARQKVKRSIAQKKDRAKARKELQEDRERFTDLEEYAWQQHNHASSSLDNTLRILRGRALKQKQQDKVEVRRSSRSVYQITAPPPPRPPPR
jgi:hypothetical protein